MSGATVWAVIPARYDSHRFPGKALVSLCGKPMVQHCHERALRSAAVSQVLVATDDTRIAAAVKDFGGEAVHTGVHPTGTDRIAEAVKRYAAQQGKTPEWVLNLQGDEPLIDPADLESLIGGMRHTSEGVLGTLVYPLQTPEERQDPHVVKVVLDGQRRALYFSRAPIPYPRQGAKGLGWRHLGVYLFRWDFLHTFTQLPPTPLSQTEELEQLRALEHGYPIHCFPATTLTVGVDVPEDVPRVEALLGG